jgi:hypothetical protein
VLRAKGLVGELGRLWISRKRYITSYIGNFSRAITIKLYQKKTPLQCNAMQRYAMLVNNNKAGRVPPSVNHPTDAAGTK